MVETDAKMALATQFGATHTVNSAAPDCVAKVIELSEGRGVDYAFVTDGAKSAIEQSLGLLAKGGTAVIVGMPASGVMAQYDPGNLAAMGQRLIGSKMGSRWPQMASKTDPRRIKSKIKKQLPNRHDISGLASRH